MVRTKLFFHIYITLPPPYPGMIFPSLLLTPTPRIEALSITLMLLDYRTACLKSHCWDIQGSSSKVFNGRAEKRLLNSRK